MAMYLEKTAYRSLAGNGEMAAAVSRDASPVDHRGNGSHASPANSWSASPVESHGAKV